ncbi:MULTISPECIES: bacterioferritin-associated ferredoxin [Marinobacter]|uniref:Bacterioferritin-associated ferredoxin n=1 Tax=Marinobacter suaedae TaxID=3057675 RepID=A0ABT8W0C4_9GAMM|nr:MULTISPECIES: bacterioferritin-associated ferredoxin [unclassified Marinobacter]MBZ2170281.1 bacterioferritin-associated ferredoxin [Marinobacter sp. F4216]MDO3721679.1 bacterioferritin-associated ferredoxin [Marinobacter sp. chi1]
MYVCLCQGVTDRAIREAAENGVTSMRELGMELGVARQCGRCARMARDILDECTTPDYVALADMLAQPAA